MTNEIEHDKYNNIEIYIYREINIISVISCPEIQSQRWQSVRVVSKVIKNSTNYIKKIGKSGFGRSRKAGRPEGLIKKNAALPPFKA